MQHTDALYLVRLPIVPLIILFQQLKTDPVIIYSGPCLRLHRIAASPLQRGPLRGNGEGPGVIVPGLIL